jgi:hypothetical protein
MWVSYSKMLERRSGSKDELLVFVVIIFIVVVIVIIIVVIIFIVVEKIAVFLGSLYFFLFVIVIGDAIEGDRVGLGHFQFRFTFGATKNFAFFDFVLVDVDFSGTFRAADHGSSLR